MKITRCTVSFDGYNYEITMHYFDGGKLVETFGHMGVGKTVLTALRHERWNQTDNRSDCGSQRNGGCE